MGLVPPLLRRVRRSMPALLVAWCALLAVGSLSTPTAHAVNALVGSNPADNASLASSPTSMLFTFAEPLGPTNTVAVTCNGAAFPVSNATVNADGLSLTVAVPNPMPAGTCNAVYLVSAPDSTSNGTGSITFTITGDAPALATTVPATGSTVITDTTVPATVAPATATDSETSTQKVGGPLGLSRMVAAFGLAVL